jgi:transcriptional regulator with GAF, ATPase, and Fis domain
MGRLQRAREQAAPQVLVVDDDCDKLIPRLEGIFGEGIRWIEVNEPDVEVIRNHIQQNDIKAVLLDLHFAEFDEQRDWQNWSGFRVLNELSEMRREGEFIPAIVILTIYGESYFIQEAMSISGGCLFFLRKSDLSDLDDPQRTETVRSAIRDALEWTKRECERRERWESRDRLIVNVKRLPNPRLEEAREIRPFEPRPMESQIIIVGKSPSMQVIYDLIEEAASNDEPVVIYGESGTGKELIARAIHYHENSRRRQCPLVMHNMAVIGEDRGLVQAQLFGSPWNCPNMGDPAIVGIFQEASNLDYEPPVRRGRSRIRNCGEPGTLFMDEFADMPLWVQAMLLRVVEERYAIDLAGNPYPADIRLICATNKSRDEILKEGKFRLDLLNRLESIVIRVPSLNERLKECPEDIDLLIDHFITQANQRFGRNVKVVLPADKDLFKRPIWKNSNVRKLENIIRECVRASQGYVLELTEEARKFLTETPEEE